MVTFIETLFLSLFATPLLLFVLYSALHHFIANSEESVKQLRRRRLKKIKKALNSAITVVIDETEDRKKGRKPDSVARQYLGRIG